MSSYGLLVIGSGPAGVSAARAYLEAGGRGPVALVTSDIDEPYERPPLSKQVLAGDKAAQGDPIGGSPLPEEVELRLGTSVTDLDLAGRTVSAGGETIGFERLVIATGAHPLPFPAADPDAEVHQLRSLDDARRLTAAAQRSRNAVVIGSGFIGCEAAASLARRGVATTLVTPEAAPQVNRLGEYAAARISEWLTGLGVELRTGVEVTGIQAPRTVHLSDGTTLAPDVVLAAVGIEAGAGALDCPDLQMHEGRVVVDEHLAAAPGIWVAGDSARALNTSAARPLAVEHWGDALVMGELAGSNAAASEEEQQPWDSVPGFWSTIGEHTLKYAAWGDGHEREEVVERTGGFTVWYGDANGTLVGVLTYNADDDYERGEALIASGADLTAAKSGARPDPGDPEESGESDDGES